MQITSASIANKDIRFTRQLAILALAGSLFYLLFDTFSGTYGFLGIYFILIAGAFMSIFLLKKNKTLLAKGVLLFTANVTVTLFASVENLETGIYYYYVLLSIASFTLYGFKNRVLAFLFIALSVNLFLFVLFTDVALIPRVNLTSEYIKGSLLLNFIIIMFTTITIIYYLIKNNYVVESTLNNQREDLIKTTTELEKSQRKFELAIQGSSAAIWDWDITNDVIHVTPKLAEIFGRPIHELEGRTKDCFLAILHPEDVASFEMKLENHFNYREKFELECRVKTGEGKYVWIFDSGQAEWDNSYRPTRMVGTIVDINEKKLAVERVKEQNIMLAKTNEELDRFVYSTSHDLRAPLSSLLGLINIAGNSSNEEERDDLIKMMKNQIIKLDSYIQDITDYSRNARVDIVKEFFPLREVVEEAIQNLKYMEGAENVKFYNDISSEYKIYSDKGRFKIIINNLISNAIKYQDPEKRAFLKVQVNKNSHSDIVYFEDNGLGIEKCHQDKVFQMFYRASDRSRGSGLGLYISHEIASKIGLDLTLESEYGSGSVFILTIPNEVTTLA